MPSGIASPEDAFAYGLGIPKDATWRNLLPAAELGLSMAPGSGEAMSARDAWDASGRAAGALERGEYGNAMSEYMATLLASLGAVPGLGVVARGTKRGAAWMDQNLPEGFNRLLDAVYPSDPASTTNIFAGPTAKTADQAALSQAQELATQGASREDIWNQTGWFQGADGKWRFEIDDSAAQLSGVKPDKAGMFQTSKSGSFTGLDHPEYSAAYGDVPGMYGKYGPDVEIKGSYLGDPTGEGRPPYIAAEGRDQNDARSVALHELQHVTQDAEGFARGSNPKQFERPMEGFKRQSLEFQDAYTLRKIADETGVSVGDATQIFKQRHGYEPHGRAGQIAEIHPQDKIQSMQAKLDQMRNESLNSYGTYHNTAGEVEARNVQRRRKFSAEDRRATPPWETQDVPDDQQIVRFGNQGPAYSIPDGPSAKRRISGSTDSPERPRKTTEHLVYHGTPTELTGGKFDPDRIRSHGGGFYFSDNPAVAEFYSKQPNISSGKSSPQVIPAYIDTEGFLVKDYGGKSYKEMVRDAAEIKASGKYRGIIGKNVKDAAQVDDVGITYIPQTQYLTWTPNTVRSSKTDNQLYNAAPYIAAPALGYGLYGTGDDEQ